MLYMEKIILKIYQKYLTVIYSRIVYDYRSQKNDPNSDRITVVGDFFM